MTDRKATEDEIQFARSMISSSEFWQNAFDMAIEGMKTFEQLDEIYAEYAKSIDKPSLTDLEKKQAIVNHVLRLND